MNNVKTTKQVVEIYELLMLFCNIKCTKSGKQDKKGRGINFNCSKFARIYFYIHDSKRNVVLEGKCIIFSHGKTIN